MATVDSSKFYADKGLKRTTLTLHPNTIETLGVTAKEYTKTVKTTSQGEIVDVMAALYLSNPQFKEMLDSGIRDHLAKKEIKKMGRPTSTLKGKLNKLSEKDLAELEELIEQKLSQ